MGVGDYHGPIKISIHVPRERDDIPGPKKAGGGGISIHVPRERDDAREGQTQVGSRAFQSTSLVRGTTGRSLLPPPRGGQFQSTSLVRGTTLGDQVRKVVSRAFQSTSLVRGTTHKWQYTINSLLVFQSTSLVRGTTLLSFVLARCCVISIHVPRERDDELPNGLTYYGHLFQSTSLVRGTTPRRGVS